MTNKKLWLALVAAALLVLPWLPSSSSWVTTLSYIALYALPALGVVLMTGTAGMLSFGQASFMGIGAYTSAVFVAHFGGSPWLGLVFGWILAGGSSWLLGAITLRMSGHYLPIATLAWGFAITIGFMNFDVLGRNDGISGIAPLSLGPLVLDTQVRMYYLIIFVLALALLLMHNLLQSGPGRAMRSLLVGVTMPEAMGIDSAREKRMAFVIAALLASTSGWLYAHMVKAISPSAFGPQYSLEFVFMTVIGGATSIYGAVVGAAVIVLSKDVLQTYLPRLLSLNGSYESIVLGLGMTLLLIRAREGAWPYLMRKLGVPDRRVRFEEDRALLDKGDRIATAGGHLQVEGIVKKFQGLVAVNEVSLEVKPGEIIALIGPNGAGKSTTFNLITGVLPLTSGQVTFNGVALAGKRSRQIAKQGVFRTFQHVKLVPAMSVLENVAMGAHLGTSNSTLRSLLRLDRRTENQMLTAAEFQARRVGLGDVLHVRAGSLSLGQQRLVEIARALVAAPSLLLLDEPAAGLRHAEKVSLAALLQELRTQGVSVLLVEHDMQFVMGLVDRLYVLNFGTLIAQGTPAQIKANEQVRAAYLGSA